jgi:hypothetical protein
MRWSAFTIIPSSSVVDALPLMAHPRRWASEIAMPAKIPLLVALVLVCASSYGQQAVSPKLLEFLTAHPEAQTVLSNVLSEAQTVRAVHLYYFYASERCHLPTMHRYLEDFSIAGIFVRENQPACDECIDIVFEALNLKGEKRFRELWSQARSGTITREDFVTEMQRQELQAVVEAKKLVSGFKLSKKEAAESWNYTNLMQMPTEFEQYVAHSKTVSHGQYQKEYEEEYDALRGSHSGGIDPVPNPQGGANGRQPVQSETNRTSAAAASRRSP